MLNAYNMWLVNHDIDPTKKPPLRQFQYSVATQLLMEYGEPTTKVKGRRHVPQDDRLTGRVSRHHAVQTDIVNGKRRQLDCYVCSHTTKRPRKRTRVTAMCRECCYVGLCVFECFRDYHSLKEF